MSTSLIALVVYLVAAVGIFIDISHHTQAPSDDKGEGDSPWCHMREFESLPICQHLLAGGTTSTLPGVNPNDEEAKAPEVKDTAL
jgi:hypothetical protein